MAKISGREARDLPDTRFSFWLAAYLFLVVMLGTTVPTPLYVIYQDRMGFSELMITLVFAAYAVGVIVGLIFLGGLADQIGRRRAQLLGLALAAASTLVFLLAANVPLLFVGRLLSGLSVGVVSGAVTAHLIELHPRGDEKRAALVSTAANMGGLALGPLIAGLLAEYVAWPTMFVYLVFMGLLTPGLLVLGSPETAPVAGQCASPKPQHLLVPGGMRASFFASGAAAFAAFALLGLLSSLAPSFLEGALGKANLALAGLVTFLLFGAAAGAQLVSPRLPAGAGLYTGLTLLPIGLAGIVLALPSGSLALFIAGTVIGGAGAGLAFKSGLAIVSALAPGHHRASVVSGFYLLAYLGLTIPVIGAGLVLTYAGPFASALIFSLVVGGFTVLAGTLAWRSRGAVS